MNLTVKTAGCVMVDDDDESAAKGSGRHTCEVKCVLLAVSIESLYF